jgi:tRNA dimethylallyltransferase
VAATACERPLLVVVTGPTGSGKSELALQLAQQLERSWPAELISVDSALVYRGMDIGTAKPSAALRARWPHHLIDIRDPAQSYSAGEFVRDALGAIAAIHSRGHLPLLVGGTMLYQRALYAGLATLPPASATLRRELDAQATQRGWAALHAELAQVDPTAAARIAPNDAQRIQRALEVYRLTGVPLSHWQRQTQGRRAAFRWLRYALLPDSRERLRGRLAQRLRRMMQAGFVEEVGRLYTRGDLSAQHPSMRAVGYRQLWQIFAAGVAPADAEREALQATAQLAKRQLTWLRRDAELIRLAVAADAAETVGRVGALAAQILAARAHDRPDGGC